MLINVICFGWYFEGYSLWYFGVGDKLKVFVICVVFGFGVCFY